jgi:hypothetical protein
MLIGGILAVALLGTAAVVAVPEAFALTDEEREARRAERDAAREARRAELEAKRAAREAEREAGDEADEEQTEEAACSCSASLGFSRPSLEWRSSGLTFVPRVDVTVRTRGEAGGPDWSADMSYDGSAAFASEDVAAPGPVSFSGSQHVAGGSCGDNRYTFRGLALAPVSFSGLTRSLLGIDQELAGTVRLNARVEGCGFDEEQRMFTFEASEFGNLRVHTWRTPR